MQFLIAFVAGLVAVNAIDRRLPNYEERVRKRKETDAKIEAFVFRWLFRIGAAYTIVFAPFIIYLVAKALLFPSLPDLPDFITQSPFETFAKIGD